MIFVRASRVADLNGMLVATFLPNVDDSELSMRDSKLAWTQMIVCWTARHYRLTLSPRVAPSTDLKP